MQWFLVIILFTIFHMDVTCYLHGIQVEPYRKGYIYALQTKISHFNMTTFETHPLSPSPIIQLQVFLLKSIVIDGCIFF